MFLPNKFSANSDISKLNWPIIQLNPEELLSEKKYL